MSTDLSPQERWANSPPPWPPGTTAGSSPLWTSATRRAAISFGCSADLQALVREALLEAIAQGGRTSRLGDTPLTTEQLTRLLDALREGEGGVKHGLAEQVNFEVTLLKAVEASRARAIDSLIKELAALADEAGGAPDSASTEGSAAGEKKKG